MEQVITFSTPADSRSDINLSPLLLVRPTPVTLLRPSSAPCRQLAGINTRHTTTSWLTYSRPTPTPTRDDAINSPTAGVPAAHAVHDMYGTSG
jgi:hypothetical protein